jgi:hypothetical protein
LQKKSTSTKKEEMGMKFRVASTAKQKRSQRK